MSFGSLLAPLLYVSSNQINFAVPPVSQGPASAAVMQVTVNGVSSSPRQLAVTSANPHWFVTPDTYQTNSREFAAVALNADGSQNSPTNPAKLGSVISVFVNGLVANPNVPQLPLQLYTGGAWSVTNFSQANPFVLEVNLRIPSSSANFGCSLQNASVCTAPFRFFDLTSYLDNPQPSSTSGLAFGGIVYVTK